MEMYAEHSSILGKQNTGQQKNAAQPPFALFKSSNQNKRALNSNK